MLENHYFEGKIEAGCDEAGRGCLAGSVYAAAVILPVDYNNPGLNDSKKLTAAKRQQLRIEIERDAVAWAVGVVTPEEIDEINILRASFLAMHRALDQLKVRPEAIIVDGNRLRQAFLPRLIVMTIWTSLPRNILIMIGKPTRVILPRLIVRESVCMVLVHIIVNRIIYWEPSNSLSTLGNRVSYSLSAPEFSNSLFYLFTFLPFYLFTFLPFYFFTLLPFNEPFSICQGVRPFVYTYRWRQPYY